MMSAALSPIAVLLNAGNPNRITAKYHFYETPSHLLGMGAQLNEVGYDVRYIDPWGEGLRVRETIRRTLEDKPRVVGITLFGGSPQLNNFGLTFLKGMPEEVRVVTGGPGISQPFFRRIFLANRRPPDFAVVGEGENPMDLLIGADFKHEDLAIPDDGSVKISRSGDTTTLINMQHSAMDALGIERPREWGRYRYQTIDAQRGCLYGGCSFCESTTVWGWSSYKFPEAFETELSYLSRTFDSPGISFRGPDFSADPVASTAIIDTMNKAGVKGRKVLMYGRVDSLYQAVSSNRDIWREFTRNNKVTIIVGYESGIPTRLMRLTKYHSRAIVDARQHLSRFANILEMLPDLHVIVDWILMDGSSNLLEISLDLALMIGLLKKFPEQTLLNQDQVFNYFRSSPGASKRRAALGKFGNLDSDSTIFLYQSTRDPKMRGMGSRRFGNLGNYRKFIIKTLEYALSKSTILLCNPVKVVSREEALANWSAVRARFSEMVKEVERGDDFLSLGLEGYPL